MSLRISLLILVSWWITCVSLHLPFLHQSLKGRSDQMHVKPRISKNVESSEPITDNHCISMVHESYPWSNTITPFPCSILVPLHIYFPQVPILIPFKIIDYWNSWTTCCDSLYSLHTFFPESTWPLAQKLTSTPLNAISQREQFFHA